MIPDPNTATSIFVFSCAESTASIDASVGQVSVEVDTDRTWVDTLSLSLVPRNVFRRHCPLLDTNENITGTITVEGPPSKRVSERERNTDCCM